MRPSRQSLSPQMFDCNSGVKQQENSEGITFLTRYINTEMLSTPQPLAVDWCTSYLLKENFRFFTVLKQTPKLYE